MPDHNVFDQRFGVGQRVLRTEDPRLLTGAGRYTDDVGLPGQLHAVFARSVFAHGRLMGVDTSRAAHAPGVVAVYTGADLEADGLAGLPNMMPLKGRGGAAMRVPHHPALASDRIRHVGEAIAVVVADTVAHARDAAELIEADIRPLPAVVDMTTAEKAADLFEDAAGNLCIDWHEGDEKATEEAFARAAHVTRLRLDNNRVVTNALEPRAAVASWDGGRFTVYAPSQGAHSLRNMLAMVFKLDASKVRVVSGDVGGSFGMKGQPYDGTVAAMYAARKLGRPVKWCADRQESFLSDQQGRASLFDAELALDRDGRFLAIRLKGWGDVGAYVTAMGPVSPTAVLSRNLPSVYRFGAMSVSTRGVFTSTVPTGPYRGAGRPESKYMVERLVDQAARELGIDRVELRRRNLVQPGDMPYTTPNGPVYDSGDFPACLEESLAKADWKGFAARKKESEKKGRLRGIAVSPYLEHTAGPGKELADIRFSDDGTVTVVTAGKDMGTGHASPFAQVVAQSLGIPFAKVRIDQTDSDRMQGPGGSGGARSGVAASGAILEAAQKVIENGRKAAGEVLEAAAADIEFKAGRFQVVGTDRGIALLELAARVPGKLDAWVSHSTHGATFPNGSHVCEVEVDPETGEVDIVRYTVVDDFGNMINPMIVEGQVQGGIAQGVGQALMERAVYDDEGQLLTGSLMDYCLPRASDMPAIDFSTHPVPAKTNPLGIKGCGEAGVAGSLPAVANAVLDAIGVAHLDTPLTPHRIWQALQQK
jgi:carbon-monoxide dehydrogenase large subunit